MTRRVPELCRRHGKLPEQTPRIAADPIERRNFILLTQQQASQSDIGVLKGDAYRLAFVDRNLTLAEQICLRAISATPGHDTELLQLYSEIKKLMEGGTMFSTEQSLKSNPTAKSQHHPSTSVKEQVKSQHRSERSNEKLSHEEALRLSQKIAAQARTEIEKGRIEQDKDYKELRSFLELKMWRDADMKTHSLMMKVLGKSNIDSLSAIGDAFKEGDFNTFPCQDLLAIDRLWVSHSNNHFGFSIQKKIWEECGCPEKVNSRNWYRFGERIGWNKNGNWLSYEQLSLTHTGELPRLPFSDGLLWSAKRIFKRLSTCSINGN